jgi:hypothetical protein
VQQAGGRKIVLVTRNDEIGEAQRHNKLMVNWITSRPNWTRWLLLVPVILLQLSLGLALAVLASLLKLNGPVQEGLFGSSFLWAISSASAIAPSNKPLVASVCATATLASTATVISGLLSERLQPSWWFFALSLTFGSLLCLWYMISLAWQRFRKRGARAAG